MFRRRRLPCPEQRLVRPAIPGQGYANKISEENGVIAREGTAKLRASKPDLREMR